jgi:hypothetical protein
LVANWTLIMANSIFRQILVMAVLLATVFAFVVVPTASAAEGGYTNFDVTCVRDIDCAVYDPNACVPGGAAADEAAPSEDSSAVYMVGDSIALRAKDRLDAAFEAKNLEAYINASTSRSITKPGISGNFKTSGLDAVEGDQERVKNAGIVIVELGTNQRDADFAAAIKDMVNKIKGYNAAAKVYWVNVFSESGVDREAANKTIADQASALDYAVINTAGRGIDLELGQ